MADPEKLNSEKLVEIHRARSEWECNLLVGYLGEHGIEAAPQAPPAVPPLDVAEEMMGSGRIFGVFVLEHDVERATSLVREFLSAASDENLLEEEAAHKLHLDRESIARLRQALREEGQTFELLGWLGLIFLAAATLLWGFWPAWLKVTPPIPALRWLMLVLLVLACAFLGRRVSRRR